MDMERQFSKSGDMATWKRGRLVGETVWVTQLVKNWDENGLLDLVKYWEEHGVSK